MLFKQFKNTKSFIFIRKYRLNLVSLLEKVKSTNIYKKHGKTIDYILIEVIPNISVYFAVYYSVEFIYWFYKHVMLQPTISSLTPRFLDKGFGWKHSIIPPHLESYDFKGTKEFYELREDMLQTLVYDTHLHRFIEDDHPERESSRIVEAALSTSENQKVINEVLLETNSRLKSKGISPNLGQIRREKLEKEWKKDFENVKSIILPGIQ